ncbi:MAG: NAD(P)/FAD-dependent oxidoreductase [Acidobacteria bacterium]|nr:NAD(P)/FAD-dependent oxidoreductase [Acidobacteriota bacterium]
MIADGSGRESPSADVVVVGAGLAGLQCARLIAEAGLGVVLLDRKEDLGDRVHTTGIFVRKSLEDFAFPAGCLGPPVRRVVLYSPARRALRLSSRRDEFRVGRMGALYRALLDRCQEAGVRFWSGTRFCGSRRAGEGLLVEVERGGRSRTLQARFLVGADGANSRVARDLGLDSNTEWLIGLESVHVGVPSAEGAALHCFLDPRIAPGYLAWVVQDGEETHVGVGGYPDRFHPQTALAEFTASLDGHFALDKGRLLEERGGRIPVNGVLRRISTDVGLLVGDAAGAVSPLTAGGFDACLRLSRQAAEVIARRFETGDPGVLATYSGAKLRARFWSRRWMRALLAGVRSRTAMELVCLALRCPPFSNVAWQVFFRRRSFPDAE